MTPELHVLPRPEPAQSIPPYPGPITSPGRAQPRFELAAQVINTDAGTSCQRDLTLVPMNEAPSPDWLLIIENPGIVDEFGESPSEFVVLGARVGEALARFLYPDTSDVYGRPPEEFVAKSDFVDPDTGERICATDSVPSTPSISPGYQDALNRVRDLALPAKTDRPRVEGCTPAPLIRVLLAPSMNVLEQKPTSARAALDAFETYVSATRQVLDEMVAAAESVPVGGVTGNVDETGK